jgi:hypothetical protein
VKRSVAPLALLLAAALALPAVAPAQDNPFGPLPPAPAEQTPTPQPLNTDSSGDDVGRNTLVIILGAVVALFVGIGWFITRDARASLPEDRRRDDPRLREEGPHRRPRQAKAKARSKAKAQKRARRASRRAR